MPLPCPAPAWMSTCVPGPRQLLDADRDHGHAVLVRLDLLGHADDHVRPRVENGSFWKGGRGESRSNPKAAVRSQRPFFLLRYGYERGVAFSIP